MNSASKAIQSWLFLSYIFIISFSSLHISTRSHCIFLNSEWHQLPSFPFIFLYLENVTVFCLLNMFRGTQTHTFSFSNTDTVVHSSLWSSKRKREKTLFFWISIEFNCWNNMKEFFVVKLLCCVTQHTTHEFAFTFFSSYTLTFSSLHEDPHRKSYT